MIHVSFQGERGAYSEDAARSFFNEKILMIETVPLTTFAEVLENTAMDKTEYAILPVENSLEIGRAHVWTPVTSLSRMPSSAWKKKKNNKTHTQW